MTIDEILEGFAFLDQWDDRYRYVIELGKGLAPLPEEMRTEANKVQGCASQVWLYSTVLRQAQDEGLRQAQDEGLRQAQDEGPVLSFAGDSDAHIVRGLVAILLALYSGRPAREILSADAIALFEKLGLKEHLTPQRSNGFRSMVERIRRDAREALAAAGTPA